MALGCGDGDDWLLAEVRRERPFEFKSGGCVATLVVVSPELLAVGVASRQEDAGPVTPRSPSSSPECEGHSRTWSRRSVRAGAGRQLVAPVQTSPRLPAARGLQPGGATIRRERGRAAGPRPGRSFPVVIPGLPTHVRSVTAPGVSARRGRRVRLGRRCLDWCCRCYPISLLLCAAASG